MGLFAKKCGYCKTKIERDKELKKDVKVPGFIGTSTKYFCCEEHSKKYENEMDNHIKKSGKSSRGCCG